jgi:hypothetical protein
VGPATYAVKVVLKMDFDGVFARTDLVSRIILTIEYSRSHIN